MYDHTDLEDAIMGRVMMGVCSFGPLTLAEHEGIEAYERYCTERENECGNSISTGGFDPYGTSCDLMHGHAGPHEGPDYFGEGRMSWEGGGSCAGDPLPVRNVEHIETASCTCGGNGVCLTCAIATIESKGGRHA